MSRTALVAYVPVLHAGYLEMIERVFPATIFLVDDELLVALPDEFDYVKRKDAIRALPTEVVRKMLEATNFMPVERLSEHIGTIIDSYDRIVMPDEDVSRYFAEHLFGGRKVKFESIFLRWDRRAVAKQEDAAVVADVVVSDEELDRLFITQAEAEAPRSFDWWRQVGAVLVKDGTVLFASHNHHTPHPQAPNAFGDPRSLFKRGVRIECSSAEHAEADIIAEAARLGISLKGASLYVSAFPCPGCARLIAHSGIKRCAFSGGYSVLHGADDLRRAGVQLIYIASTRA